MDEKAFYHYTEGKRRVMSQQVEKCFTDAHLSRNIISLGDGDFEREALREIRTIEQNRRRRSGEKVKIMLKTIKMLDDPTVDDYVCFRTDFKISNFFNLLEKPFPEQFNNFSCETSGNLII